MQQSRRRISIEYRSIDPCTHTHSEFHVNCVNVIMSDGLDQCDAQSHGSSGCTPLKAAITSKKGVHGRDFLLFCRFGFVNFQVNAMFNWS